MTDAPKWIGITEENAAQTMVDSEGHIQTQADFRLKPIAWTLEPKDSGAVAIAIQFEIISKWAPGKDESDGAWSQEWPTLTTAQNGYCVYNRSWIIKKRESGGGPNEGTVKALVDAGLWGGDLGEIVDEGGTPLPPRDVVVIGTVSREEYKGKFNYRVAWLNANTDKVQARGGGFKPVDSGLLESLRARHQGSLKAIVGGQPTGNAAAPPPSVAPTPPGATNSGDQTIMLTNPVVVGASTATPAPPNAPAPPGATVDPLLPGQAQPGAVQSVAEEDVPF